MKLITNSFKALTCVLALAIPTQTLASECYQSKLQAQTDDYRIVKLEAVGWSKDLSRGHVRKLRECFDAGGVPDSHLQYCQNLITSEYVVKLERKSDAEIESYVVEITETGKVRMDRKSGFYTSNEFLVLGSVNLRDLKRAQLKLVQQVGLISSSETSKPIDDYSKMLFGENSWRDTVNAKVSIPASYPSTLTLSKTTFECRHDRIGNRFRDTVKSGWKIKN